MNKRMCVMLIIMCLAAPAVVAGQSSTSKKATPRVSFDFMDADIRNVLRVLTDVSGKNIVIADDVKGKITMKLENVLWDEALDMVVRTGDFRKIEEDRLIRVISTKKYEEEMAKERKITSELLRERTEKLKSGIDAETKTVYINYHKAVDMKKMIEGGDAKDAKKKGLLSEGGSVTVVEWTNALIVRDFPSNVQSVMEIIKEHDYLPPQIQIEARIVQASTNFSKELGVQWGANYSGRILGEDVGIGGGRTSTPGQSNDTYYKATTGQWGWRGSNIFPYQVNMPAGAGAGVFGFFIGSAADSLQLDVQLSALEAQGKGKILSHPKVVTSNNTKSYITHKQKIPYQTSSANLGTNIQFQDAELRLEVTPQVSRDGNIKMKIKTMKGMPDWTIAVTNGPPGINTKEAETEVIVKNGETVVIGGIFESEDKANDDGVPFLNKIPILGWLFKHEKKSNTKTELLIFVTPTLIERIYKERDEG